ncbi:hypothetical protein N7532_000229 [Penicillium argentinense]|uniref:Uncharacterized protein n=1 Tax=Penicillium argentinense TaxID=1131581 RepID=A0A9W9KMF4_9EURO|nr:uncharacterized protein N7532_000229 [Penicillium argentinense]KAJ5112184.1 hypothetical protein N7532_000229 [Penicillium argentinense]
MTTQSTTIDSAAFAEAVQDLPLSSLFNKVSELRNSIAHLHRSNSEIREFADASKSEDEKKELEGYIVENEGVIRSMEERVGLLRVEVERRGQEWVEERKADEERGASDTNGDGGAQARAGAGAGSGADAGAGVEEGVYL